MLFDTGEKVTPINLTRPSDELDYDQRQVLNLRRNKMQFEATDYLGKFLKIAYSEYVYKIVRVPLLADHCFSAEYKNEDVCEIIHIPTAFKFYPQKF